ncbi:MAG: protein kinase, partial [Sedimentisphaerales bacterium]|nr:protein kinase [Sedimentisphaerales bacterium]
MQEFQYKYGDKPLEGYIIQRAAGRGGFGEVYYAVSDSGRQVALKVIQNYEQTELRGISQCMNLKSPHLVTIFDVKYNAEEKPFVIMEYVSGPSLRDMLNDAPSGMGEQKTAFFLREIAKGLSYLHECGIVHRDLKPGNIFYENGYVKIGDYGLSKLINTGRHSQQTITVGTVNYMAPEIGAGCYDRSVDIYALGILLYEMLTGQVPFFGSSPAEVLMKHMTAEPDLRNISEPFKRAITKALTKDPKERYRNVQEMVEDVFGAEHVRNSISQFSPDSLTVYADQVAKKVKGASPETAQQKAKADDSWEKIGRQIGSVGDRWTEKVRDRFTRPRHHGRYASDAAVELAAAADPITRRQRRILALITTMVVSLGVGLISGRKSDEWLGFSGLSFTMIWGAAAGILLVRWRLLRNLEKSSLRNIMAVAAGIIVAALLSMIIWSEAPREIEHLAKGTFLALAVMGFINWWKITSSLRKERVVLGRVIWLCCLGFVAAQMFHGHSVLVIGVLAGTVLVVQIACPFVPKAARDGFKRRKHSQETTDGLHNRPAEVPPPQHAAGWGHLHRTFGEHNKRTTSGTGTLQKVPLFVRIFWLIGFLILLTMGLMFLIWAGMERMLADNFARVISFGVGSLVFALFCLIRSVRKYFTGWYSYLIKPLLLLACLQTIITSSICLGCINFRNEETLVALFFIIFPGILFLVVLSIPKRVVEGLTGRVKTVPPNIRVTAMVSPYKRVWALILSAGIFLGFGGLHRFYVGKVGTGILWLLTGGVLGIGQIVDIIMILLGRFRDSYGYPLVMWESPDELKNRAGSYQPIKEDGAVQPPTSPGEPHAVAEEYSEQIPDAVGGVPPQPGMDRVSPVPSNVIGPRYSEPFNIVSFLFSWVGTTFLLLAFLVGLALALHVPAVIAAGIPDPELAQELDKLFGGPGWPGILDKIGFAVATILFLLAMTFTIIARRRSGGAHIIRAGVGMLGLVLSLSALSDTLPKSYPKTLYRSFENNQ